MLALTVAVIAGHARPADAQECVDTGAECDELSDYCPDQFCEGDVLGASGYESDGSSIKVDYSQSEGAITGSILLADEDTRPYRPDDWEPSDVDRTANLVTVEAGVSTELDEDGQRTYVIAQGALRGSRLRIPWEELRGTVPVPIDQGIVRLNNQAGLPVDLDVEGKLMDPVDPVTGEFVMHHADLAFPSFGVPFTHARVYRSRVSYDGPFGPGWDHGYNQRLVLEPEAPPIDLVPTGDPTELDPYHGQLPPAIASDHPVNPGATCGPVLILTTGHATTLRFRETSRVDGAVEYVSDAGQLRLEGETLDGVFTWTLTTPQGDVRGFDAHGLLATWRDANGIGLTFTWEPGTDRDWRLAAVADSVERRVEYRYDDLDRVVRVIEPVSGLEASYEYGDQGELRRATRGDGRSETYGYDVAHGDRGDWVPEQQLHQACDLACAVSSSSCDAGGACDAPVAEVTQQCLASCGTCASTCKAGCETGCDEACDGCETDCETDCAGATKQAEIADICAAEYVSTGSEAVCERCDDICSKKIAFECVTPLKCAMAVYHETPTVEACIQFSSLEEAEDLVWDLIWLVAQFLAGIWDVVLCELGFDCSADDYEEMSQHLCDNHPVQCCADGDDCGSHSCNAGQSCTNACRQTWLGDPVSDSCLAPVIDQSCFYQAGWNSAFLPQLGSEEYDELEDCAGDTTDWSLEHGCKATLTDFCEDDCSDACTDGCEPPCLDACGDYCDTECHVADCGSYCDSLDFAGLCEDSCASACVDAAHAAGSIVGPKYGHPADLDYNLTRVYDGAGRLWLENSYGTDVSSPDFDTVVHQQYGAYTAEMTHVDLRAIANGDADLTLSSAQASELDTLDTYQSVDICPYVCEVETIDPQGVLVPSGDLLLDFEPNGSGEPSLGGLLVSTNLARTIAVPPTWMRITTAGNVATAWTTRRGSKTNPLATAATTTTITLTLPEGAVTLKSRGDGSWSVAGAAAAIAGLTARGELTFLTDSTSQLRAYEGHPTTVVAVTSGTCSKPFRFERTGDDRVQITPGDACSGDLWVVPLAGPASPDVGIAFRTQGSAAIRASYLHATDFAPTRSGVVWRNWGTGTMTREVAASGAVETKARTIASAHFANTPMLSMPSADATADPFYVFQQADTTLRTIPPHDLTWSGGDMAPPFYTPPCDPTMPEGPHRGSGPGAPGARPARATLVTDLHGGHWTLYADDGGRLIRTVNHGTGAVWSFEHDPSGELTGIEAPDGSRQCMRYDTAGNLTESLSMPTGVPGLPAVEPLRQRYGYLASPSRLAAVYDPRDQSPLAQYEYDAKGNLVRMVDAVGLATTIALVGGSGPDRAQPAAVTEPGGAVHRFTWDLESGTLRTAVDDATSTTPLSYEQVSDAAGRVVWTQSPLGMVTTSIYDGAFLAGTSYAGDGHDGLTTYGYDADGKVATTTRAGRQTALRYDLIGSLVDQRDTALDASATEQTRCQKLAPGGRLIEAVSAEGHRTRNHHDAEGNVIWVEAGDLGPSAEAWDDACPAHPPGPSVAGTVASFVYDTSGRMRSMTDERGYVHAIKVDGLGRPVISTAPDGTSVRRGYDALGNVVWEAIYAPGTSVGYRPPAWGDAGLLGAVSRTFDDRGRLAVSAVWHLDDHGLAIGDGYQVTRYDHDDVARAMTVTDDLGRRTVIRRDGAGRPIETVLPDGTALTTQYLDGGRTLRRSTPMYGSTRTDITRLTAWGAIASVAVLSGSAELVTSTMTYDASLRPASSLAAAGATAAMTYDAFDRPTQIGQAPGETIKLIYDRDDRVRERHSTGATTSKWTFDVDALGRGWRTVDPGGGAQTTSYEGLSSLPQLTIDRRGTRFGYTWSQTGDLLAVLADAPPIPGMQDVRIRFTPDPLGRVLAAIRDDGVNGDDVTTAFTYDSLGDVLTESDTAFGSGAERTHRYDGLGRRISAQLGTRAVSWSYDIHDRLSSVVVAGDPSPVATFQYTGLGAPTSRTLRSGLKTLYGHDALGRLDSIVDNKADNTKLASWTWELPLDGVARESTYDQPGFPVTSSLFGADAGGRLTAEQHGLAGVPLVLSPVASTASATAAVTSKLTAAATRYTLGSRGSWQIVDKAGVKTNISLDPLDAYATFGATTPVYDSGGALTRDGSKTFTYDALGQLASTSTGTVGRIYKRDALGRIISETDTSSGAVTRYAYDGLHRTFRKVPSGDVDVTLDAGGIDDHLVTILASNQRRYYHQDRLGSVYLVTNELGAPLEWTRYTAYGEPTIRNTSNQVIATTAIGNRFGFQGQQHDWATGLVDMRARTYRPTWGRFLTLDPIGLAGGPNLYAFVNSSPQRFVDPLGLHSDYAWGDVVGALGGPVARSAFNHPKTALSLAAGAGTTAAWNDPETTVRAKLGPPPSDAELGAARRFSKGLVRGAVVDPVMGAAGLVMRCSTGNPLDCARAVADMYWESQKAQGAFYYAHATGDTDSLKAQVCGLGGGDCLEGAGVAVGMAVMMAMPIVAKWMGVPKGPAFAAGNDAAASIELGAPRGGRGTWGGRTYDPAAAGGPVRSLSTEGVRVTTRGIDVVEGHLARFGPDAANQGMVARLRSIASGELQATAADLNFYTHELREFVRYRRLGFLTGAGEDSGLWNNAHSATLADYSLVEGPSVLYHPSVLP